jgi:hypothetical protein
MKWMDTLFAWALVVLGSAHFLAAWVPKLSLLGGPWAGGAAVAIISMGLMNAVRSQRKSDSFLRWSTAVATALTAGLCLTVLYRFSGNVLHHPAAVATGVLAVFELLFAVAG